MDYRSFGPDRPGNRNSFVPEKLSQLSRKQVTPGFIGLVLVILVLAGAVYGGIWYWQKQSSQIVVPTYTPRDNMAGWKTYRNEQYGFEFKYPENWTNHNDYLTAPPKIEVLSVETMSTQEKVDSLARQDIERNNCPSSSDYGTSDHVIKSGQDTILYVLYCTATSEDYIYLTSNLKGRVIKITYRDDFDDSWPEGKKIEIFNQILSTFRFIDKVDTSTWKTYTNTQYGFEFKYPSEKTPFRSFTESLVPANSTSDYVALADNENFVEGFEQSTLSVEIIKNTRTDVYISKLPEDYKIETHNIEFQGLEAIELIGCECVTGAYKTIIIPKDGILFIIEEDLNEQLFNQILSTFRFVDTGIR